MALFHCLFALSLIFSFCQSKFLDNFELKGAKPEYLDVSDKQGLLISPIANHLTFRTLDKETHQFQSLNGKSFSYSGPSDNVKAIKTKGDQIVVTWRVQTSNNLQLVYAFFMESQSFDIIKYPFIVSSQSSNDINVYPSVIDFDNNLVVFGWNEIQGQNLQYILQKYTYEGTPVGTGVTLSTYPIADIYSGFSQNFILSIFHNSIELTLVLKSGQLQRLKTFSFDKNSLLAISQSWITPESLSITNPIVLKISNDQIGFFWQVLHSDNIRPLRVEHTIKNITQNTFSKTKVLPIRASFSIIGDYSVTVGANNILIYDQIVTQKHDTVNNTNALYQNIIKDGILLEESIPIYKDIRPLTDPFTIETKSNDIIAPNKRIVLCKVEGINNLFSQYYSSLPKQVKIASGCSRDVPTYNLVYHIESENYEYAYLRVLWEVKSSNPSPKLENKLKFSKGFRVELENDDLIPNTNYSIYAFHSTRGFAYFNFTTGYGPYLLPEICYKTRLLDTPIIQHSCRDDFLYVNTTLSPYEKPLNSNISWVINSNSSLSITPKLHQISNFEVQIPLNSIIAGIEYAIMVKTSLGSEKQIKYVYQGKCDVDNSTSFNIVESNLCSLIASYVIILIFLNILQKVSKSFSCFCIISKLEKISNPSWIRKLFTLIMVEHNILWIIIELKTKIDKNSKLLTYYGRLYMWMLFSYAYIHIIYNDQIKQYTDKNSKTQVNPQKGQEAMPVDIHKIDIKPVQVQISKKDFFCGQSQPVMTLDKISKINSLELKEIKNSIDSKNSI